MANYSKTIQNRLRSMSVLVIAISLVLLWRLFDVQVAEHGHYLAMAQDQQRFEKVEIAQRGKIYVHDSNLDPQQYYPLAFDVKRFDVWAVPHMIQNKQDAANKLAALLVQSSGDIFNLINNDKLYIPPVKKGLNLDEANTIIGQKISGVLVVPEYSRYYPEVTMASQLLGFVNSDGDGMYGFEGHYNDELKGLNGEMKGEKDTLGRVINLLDQQKPQDGTSYVLTIDRSVQYYVEKKLNEAIQQYQADSGSVAIMDIKTGGIVALASSPTFDPNNFKEYGKTNPGIFVNPVIGNLYEPGSIFKPMVMAAAVDQGAVTPETKNVFGATTTVDGFTIHTAEDKAFGEEDMAQILQNSDNVGMVWISDQLGKEKMYNYIQKFGFFNKTGIDLDTEAVGYAKALKQWHNIDRATISFGQGISVTPLQLLAGYATLANNGKYEYPHVVDKMISADGTEKPVAKQEGEQVVKTETAKALTAMLVQAVDKGHTWRAGVPGYEVAAKTGTAQIAVNGIYDKNDTGLGIYNHSLAGYAPAEDPRFAMIVKLERPKSAKYAESTAAPLFGEISSFLLQYYYRVEPTRDPALSRTQ